MKYIATLTTGDTLELSFPDGALRVLVECDTWIADENGVMVNMTHVVAIAPVAAAKESKNESEIIAIIDGDGDRWRLSGGGRFSLENLRDSYSPSEIDDHWGIKEVIRSEG